MDYHALDLPASVEEGVAVLCCHDGINMTLMSPPVGFFMPTGISSPDAVRRCCWFSTERAPTATYERRSDR